MCTCIDTYIHIRTQVPEVALKLAKEFWPGPLSICIKANPAAVGKRASAGLDTVVVSIYMYVCMYVCMYVYVTSVCRPRYCGCEYIHVCMYVCVCM